ncbi:SAV_2336 N-terminal domain-related protein [Streptomyces sp. TRM68416]|uniref:SAV_2336 N-terminal domain-related protein n=1 Tax=Streptomyces sp. TRM68416 TaxID=2758412 RepID=UPI0016620800|nr:SAV_2336 N-terminal domain-related protein [Streptomyces sp. TRM68416]MBD0843551.1 metallophosphoesterase [Streptomyces sp. TRM68416]
MSSRAPGIPTGDVSTVLTALVARMRDAGLAPGVEELADALWLAQWLPAPARRSGPTGTPPPPDDEPSPGSGTTPVGPPRTPRLPADQPAPQPPDSARLFAPGPGGDGTDTGMTPVRVPAAPALPEPLALQRGLRPLQRYRAPVRPVPRTLDEHATAQRAAESGLVLPVLRTDRRREARLLLLMDVSTSTVVWQQALDELRQVCARAGAFREVQVRYLHESPGGRPGFAAVPDPGAVLSAPEQLSDPTGRRVTLVLSDCAGPMWRSGRVQRLLHRWATTAPVAVVQPLPQRMWLRTHLPARRGLLHRQEGPAGTLTFRPDRGRAQAGALPVPVLALRRESVEGWARLVSGATGQSLAAAAGWVRADHPVSGAPVRAAEERTAAERVNVFWRPASSDARRLAVYLSAVPLYLPVMQLVQHAMLAGSGPDVLSEVLLSGLLRRREDADDPRAVRYDFLPGVATELRSRLTVDDVELLFKHCSEYVERKFGRSARNFPALAGAFLRGAVPPDARTAPGEREPAGLRAFAEVSAEVLRDLGARLPAPVAVGTGHTAAELLELGRRALARFHGEGLARELDAAVGYFQQALASARSDWEGNTASEELADALLTRWRVRRVGDDLGEAWEVVQGVFSARGRLVLGGVSWAQAQEVRAAGIDFDGIPESLRVWARRKRGSTERALHVLLYLADLSLTAALEDTAAGDAERTAAAEALAFVRRAVGELGPRRGNDTRSWYVGHLERAVAAAEAWLGLAPSAQGLAVCGRLWLDLARHYDEEPARAAAANAVDDLMHAVRDETALPDAERCRIWLDVASAAEIPQAHSDEHLATHAVDQALRAAGDDPELRLESLLRVAQSHGDRRSMPDDLTRLDRAVGAWGEAVQLLDEDDPRRPEVLTQLGRALHRRFSLHRNPDDISGSIEYLRQAVDASLPDDPRLGRRRRHLGDAYESRYRLSDVLTDLYEASWLFAEAVRGSADDPAFLAQCWESRGTAAVLLFERTGAITHLHTAIDFFNRAVEYAEEADDPELAASALTGRGQARARQGRPRTARGDYVRALGLTKNRDRARRIRTHIDRLPLETADE